MISEIVIAVGPDMRGHPSMSDLAERRSAQWGCKYRYGEANGLVGTVYYFEVEFEVEEVNGALSISFLRAP